ncbi:serine/threonine-protein kinase VRK1-like [Leptopilina heterotoma]|uniref:serine/threonine-protein kinase VRK1-like n=1 Tax=Leptopilina heterotoma TaxID=63436 RepID=UPI001CA8C8ED|nr:serine/threonine-protein kinase VRK1-like [Leptopilina heterotoma]
MAGKATAKKAPKKKGANGYKLPDPIPNGEIVTDLMKNKWIISSSIGVGGFGEIYSAAPYSGKTPKDYPNVIKIEPHGNGPLFVEMHFYMRNAKSDDIESWRKKKKLSFIGMPRFLGSGSHECNNTKYRFVVMERYSTDLWKLFLENNRVFPENTVYQVGLQIIDVLEYIHSRTYVHADIKGGNLLLNRGNENQVYLVDFGLASHYTTKPEYKLDPKKAHNGTIEYTSRDAHMGVPTMRGDIEILAYNLIQWICGALPWEKNLSDPSAVQKQKEAAFSDTNKFLKQCFADSIIPAAITQFVSLLAKMKFNDTPDYEKFKQTLIQGLKSLGKTPGDKLVFSGGKKSTTAGKIASVIETKTPVEKKVASKVQSRLPKKITTKETGNILSAVPKKIAALKRLSSEANSLNDSMIMNNSCISGDDVVKKVLANLDPGEEYEVQIKRKKRVVDKSETPEKKAATRDAGSSGKRVMRERKKNTRKQLDSDSEPEIITVGTRSRPRGKLTSRAKKNSSLNSEKDMFDDE